MIKDWAMEHQMKVKFDTKVHQDGAPEYLKPSSLDPLLGLDHARERQGGGGS